MKKQPLLRYDLPCKTSPYKHRLPLPTLALGTHLEQAVERRLLLLRREGVSQRQRRLQPKNMAGAFGLHDRACGVFMRMICMYAHAWPAYTHMCAATQRAPRARIGT